MVSRLHFRPFGLKERQDGSFVLRPALFGLPSSNLQRRKPLVHFVGAPFKLLLVGFLNLFGLPMKGQFHFRALLSKGIGQRS